MSNILEAFGTSGQAITVTLASLGNGSARESNAIDNSSNLYDDYLIMIGVKTGTITAPSYVNVWAAGTVDGGTTYTDVATGSDAAITLTTPHNYKLIGVIACPSSTTTFRGSFSVAAAFGGVVPAKFGIIIENKTGASLDATEGNHFKKFQGVYFTVA